MNYQELLHSPLLPSQIAPLIQKASHHIVPVLIQGEPGTGKELVARLIHHTGGLNTYRFYRIDCKIVREDDSYDPLYRLLKEVERETNPATLFLKEVGYLGRDHQLKLLELMEDGIFQNGVTKKIIHPLRLLSSSSVSLQEKVVQGKFSEDLYHRFNTFSIFISPLRERAQEIPKISHYLLTEHSKRMNIKKLGISDPALNLLKGYWWPGNLTELEHVIVKGIIHSDGERLVGKDLFSETDNGKNDFVSFYKKTETQSFEDIKKSPLNDQKIPSLSLFLLELVHRVKNPLVSIKTFTQLLKEKFNDEEFKEYFYKIVTEDVDKIDSLLNTLLTYIKVNTPLQKNNTVNNILEELFKKNERSLGEKKIKLFKKCGKNLPETTVHDEQLRFILETILQYAIPIIQPHGSIGFLTKSLDVQKETGDPSPPRSTQEGYVQILIGFTGYKKPMEQFQSVLGNPTLLGEEPIEIELQLVNVIIQQQGGEIKFDGNEKSSRTLISLKLPIERRKAVYYPSINI